MEARFGQDLSDVEAHMGSAGALSEIGARAATSGDQVAFSDANPSREQVVHELTHVMQFRHHGVPGSGPAVDDPSDSAELEARRDLTPTTGSSSWSRPTAQIHRDGDDDLDDNFCEDLVEKMLDVIWGRGNIKRGLARRFEQMLEDSQDLYHTRPTGENSWQGHQEQYEGLRKRLKNLLKEFFSNMCQNPAIIPDYVQEWAEKPAPVQPRAKPDSHRFELPSWEQVWQVVAMLGLSVAMVAVVLAALADPEPASKLALAGLSLVMISTILTALGYDQPSDDATIT